MKLLLLLLALAGSAFADEAVKPLRGKTPIPAEDNPADTYRMEKHDRLIRRNHKWQPPIIPHNIKGYQITRNINTCLTCHSKKAALESGATEVGESHYKDRDGKVLPNVSTRRYFCLQCHAPQYDVEPLVGNTYKQP